MNNRIISNGVVFVALLAVPLIVEFSTASPDNVPGTGFDVLLYKPFDFAFVVLAGVIFVGFNAYYSFKKRRSLWVGIGLGAVLLLAWFIISFLSVGQLHLWLGGKL